MTAQKPLAVSGLNSMTHNIKKLHAQILEAQGNVTFYNFHFYDIFETDGGYMVDVYAIKDEGLLPTEADTKLMRPIDGGLCTGSALDAIEFFDTE